MTRLLRVLDAASVEWHHWEVTETPQHIDPHLTDASVLANFHSNLKRQEDTDAQKSETQQTSPALQTNELAPSRDKIAHSQTGQEAFKEKEDSEGSRAADSVDGTLASQSIL